MKIDSVGAELFYADRQTKRETDKHKEANSRFLHFANKHKKPMPIHINIFDFHYLHSTNVHNPLSKPCLESIEA